MNYGRIDRWFWNVGRALILLQGALSWAYVLIWGFA